MAVKKLPHLFRKITQSLNANHWSVARQLGNSQSGAWLRLTREFKMSKENRSALDRELFSELTESPIHPLLINMVRPYVDSCDQKFRLQINGEALWHWREVRGKPSTAFDVLQASISHLGYKLEESARDRVGRAIATNIRNFWRKIDGISNSKNRKRVRASKWVTVSFMPNEIMLSLCFAAHVNLNCMSCKTELS